MTKRTFFVIVLASIAGLIQARAIPEMEKGIVEYAEGGSVSWTPKLYLMGEKPTEGIISLAQARKLGLVQFDRNNH